MTARELARHPVVVLAAPGRSTDVVAHALARRFDDVVVVLESPVGRARMLRRRLRRLGPTTVFGQLLFLVLVVPLLRRTGRGRALEILADHDLDARPWQGPTLLVPSVNSVEARDVLKRLDPAVVVVNGTRIIAAETLECVDAPFLNVHAGVTPQYRGVHGGYWALVERRPDLAGATVHVVDTGIDTGPVIAQPLIEPTARDNFTTYPLLQLAVALPHLIEAVCALLRGEQPRVVAPRDASAPSALRSHPTLWGYVRERLRSGVR